MLEINFSWLKFGNIEIRNADLKGEQLHANRVMKLIKERFCCMYIDTITIRKQRVYILNKIRGLRGASARSSTRRPLHPSVIDCK